MVSIKLLQENLADLCDSSSGLASGYGGRGKEAPIPGAVLQSSLGRELCILTCFLVSTSRMSIRLIMMFLCVFLYFPTRSETVSQPGRPVHMKVLLPCSFHSRTCNRGQRLSWLQQRPSEKLITLLPGEAWKDASTKHCEEHNDETDVDSGLSLWHLPDWQGQKQSLDPIPLGREPGI